MRLPAVWHGQAACCPWQTENENENETRHGNYLKRLLQMLQEALQNAKLMRIVNATKRST